MKITTTLKPRCDVTTGVISIECEMVNSTITDASGDPFVHLTTDIIRTKEFMVREALIKLGWTPPADEPPILHSVRDDATSA